MCSALGRIAGKDSRSQGGRWARLSRGPAQDTAFVDRTKLGGTFRETHREIRLCPEPAFKFLRTAEVIAGRGWENPSWTKLRGNLSPQTAKQILAQIEQRGNVGRTGIFVAEGEIQFHLLAITSRFRSQNLHLVSTGDYETQGRRWWGAEAISRTPGKLKEYEAKILDAQEKDC